MIVSASATTGLPTVGTPMFLVLGDGVNFRSRLVSVDGDTFTVAAPLETAGPATPTPGRELDVFWVPPSTRIVLATRLVAISDESPYRWTLTATDAPRQNNRREYVRGGGGAAVRLATDDHTIEGALLDISEGGLRCWVANPAKMKVGDKMQAWVTLGAGNVAVEGAVHTVRAADAEPGHHVILTFRTPEQVARVIRQHVYAWEITERRREAEL